MRGEDPRRVAKLLIIGVSPPHARGRPAKLKPNHIPTGITPACAGKTNTYTTTPAYIMDHPRMRGEDQVVDGAPVLFTGSPPHARGRRFS